MAPEDTDTIQARKDELYTQLAQLQELVRGLLSCAVGKFQDLKKDQFEHIQRLEKKRNIDPRQ
eukprot:2028177-Pyramimonas_sp.AAC.1